MSERVLDDVRKALGNAIDPPRIQRERDDEIDDGEGHHQRIEVASAPAHVVGKRQIVERDRREV